MIKTWGQNDFFMFLKDVSYTQKGYIYAIKNAVKT